MNFVVDNTLSPNDILWLNSKFEHTMFDEKCVTNGLLYVKQLYDGNCVIPVETINQTYRVSFNIIYYHSMIRTIVTKYCTNNSQTGMNSEQRKIVKIILEKPGDKEIGKKLYKYLVMRKAHYDAVSKKWDHIINMDEENSTLFNHIEKITIVNKLRSFQFKFLHRIIYFNDRLFKCKLVTSTLCDFCNEAIDSIEHRYIYCNITQEFWRQLNYWIQTEYKIECTINNIHSIITNIYNDLPLVETIMLNAKYYLYSCFLKQTMPNIEHFKHVLADIERTERYLATTRNLIHVHEQKWGRNTRT